MSRTADLDRFYALLSELAARVGGSRLLRDTNGRLAWPQRGVYFFFEPGEVRADGQTPRVVRIGTHAVVDGAGSSLWGRLRAHRGTIAGRNGGGGNHRASISVAMLGRLSSTVTVLPPVLLGGSGDPPHETCAKASTVSRAP